MVVDGHGHYTTSPPVHDAWRALQIDADRESRPLPAVPWIPDEEIRRSVDLAQRPRQRERGIDLTLFSPRAGSMGHHRSSLRANRAWAEACNDLVHRVATLFPGEFVPVGQLPQAPGVDPRTSIGELRRCVEELGFVAVNVNPDPSGGNWSDPPLTDRWWYPLFEALVELDVPAMVHASSSCNPNSHFTGAHYLNADTAVFMQLLLSDLFVDFPSLRLVLPHGGGAVPYHWGRYRGLAADLGRPPPSRLLDNIWFDTCVYHQAGIDCLTRVIPSSNLLFGSETFGAVNAADPETGVAYDDTKRYVDAADHLAPEDRALIFEGNARTVYTRLARHLEQADARRPDQKATA